MHLKIFNILYCVVYNISIYMYIFNETFKTLKYGYYNQKLCISIY